MWYTCSGGLEFEVYGHHLTSVAEPKARITAVTKQQKTVLISVRITFLNDNIKNK